MSTYGWLGKDIDVALLSACNHQPWKRSFCEIIQSSFWCEFTFSLPFCVLIRWLSQYGRIGYFWSPYHMFPEVYESFTGRQRSQVHPFCDNSRVFGLSFSLDVHASQRSLRQSAEEWASRPHTTQFCRHVATRGVWFVMIVYVHLIKGVLCTGCRGKWRNQWRGLACGWRGNRASGTVNII